MTLNTSSSTTGQQNSTQWESKEKRACQMSQMSPLKINSQCNREIPLPHRCSHYSVLANMRPLLFQNAPGRMHVQWQHTCKCSSALWESAHEQLSLLLLLLVLLLVLLTLPSFRRPAAQGRGCASPPEAARHLLRCCQVPAPSLLCAACASKVQQPVTSLGAAADSECCHPEPGVAS